MTLSPEEKQRIEAIREDGDIGSYEDVAWLLELVERQEAPRWINDAARAIDEEISGLFANFKSVCPWCDAEQDEEHLTGCSMLAVAEAHNALRSALAENPAPAAPYRDEALVERIARVLFEKEVENAQMGKASLDEEFEVNHEYWCESARAALAVIAEPHEGNSTDRG